MCNNCQLNSKSFDLCLECGKEICPLCMSLINRRIHANCLGKKAIQQRARAYGIPPVLRKHTCNNCGSNYCPYGYCVICGKEICENCKSPITRESHKKCRSVERITIGKSISEPRPAGEPTGKPRPNSEPCGFR